jgi:signal transduction histidine kinase
MRTRAFVAGYVVAALMTATGAGLALGPWTPDLWWVNVDTLAIVAEVLALGCCAVTAVRGRGRLRLSWALLGAMLLFYVGGDVLWLAYGAASGLPPILSLSDLLYVVALVPGFLGLIVYPVTRGLRSTLGPVLLDTGVLACSALLASQVAVFGEVLRISGATADFFMLLAYPVTDVLMACLVLILLLRSVGESRTDVVLLGLGFTVFAFADNGYALSVVRGTGYSDTLVGVAYVVAPLLIGLGALAAQALPTGPRTLSHQLSGTWAPVVPDLTALAALALSLVWWRQEGVAAVLAGAVLLLTGVRRLTSIRQAQRWRLELEQRIEERTAEVAAITERHRQLEAMKYSFVTAVSHELRTPLTAIRGSLEVLDDGDAGVLPPTARRVVTVAARGTQRLSRLVEDIIDLERLESGRFGFRPTPQDLHLLLVDAAESLTPLAHSAGVELVVGPGHADVVCDSDRVLQVLVNLVGNAVKFTPPGATITLDAALRNGEVEVTVRDQGRGIPDDQLAAVFDRFHQVDAELDQAKGGTGLGLTITRHIVEGHGGRIWVDSILGEGTTFHFTLPAVTPTEVSPAAEDVLPLAGSRG